MSLIQSQNDTRIRCILKSAGFSEIKKITNSLQGSVWSCIKNDTKQSVVIKVVNKQLSKSSTTIQNNKTYSIKEDFQKEMNILKYLTSCADYPSSIVKYVGFFESNKNYYFIMENGGTNLFDFIKKAHILIEAKQINMDQWHKFVKLLLKQMVEAITYIHSKNIAHFDISLENFLINDVLIDVNNTNNKIKFITDNIQIKLCDFGLAERFSNNNQFISNKYCGKPNYKSPEIVNAKHSFNAIKNDTWCLGICLFMMVTGGMPWYKASCTNVSFEYIMNGKLNEILSNWGKSKYVTPALKDLFESVFQYELERITLDGIKKHLWLSS